MFKVPETPPGKVVLHQPAFSCRPPAAPLLGLARQAAGSPRHLTHKNMVRTFCKLQAVLSYFIVIFCIVVCVCVFGAVRLTHAPLYLQSMQNLLQLDREVHWLGSLTCWLNKLHVFIHITAKRTS